MRGSWRVFRTGERWSKPGAARPGSSCAPRRSSRCSSTARCSSSCGRAGSRCIRCSRRLGPDVLDPAFDPAARGAASARRRRGSRGRRAAARPARRLPVSATSPRARGSGHAARPVRDSRERRAERLAKIYAAAAVWLAAAVPARRRRPATCLRPARLPALRHAQSKRAQGDDGRTTWWCPAARSPVARSTGELHPIGATRLTPGGAADRGVSTPPRPEIE